MDAPRSIQLVGFIDLPTVTGLAANELLTIRLRTSVLRDVDSVHVAVARSRLAKSHLDGGNVYACETRPSVCKEGS